MGMYSASELRSKISSSKREMREFEPKENKLYHLWIPKDSFFYVKKHFNIRTIPAGKNCKIKAVTCINTDPDTKKRQCPICDHIEGLWNKARSEKNPNEKKKIQQMANNLRSEYIYVNAIDINDADMPFIDLRLTKGVMETLSIAIATTPIENVIWQYKKTNKSGKIDYMLLESPNDPKAIELCKEYDHLAEREFKDGGPVDIMQALSYETTEAKYLELLSGEAADADATDDDADDADDESVADKKVAKKTAAPKKTAIDVEIEDDDSISLDEVDMEEVEKPVTAKKAAPKAAPKVADDDIELDDDLGLDDEPVAPKKTAAKPATKPVAAPVVADDDIDLDDLEIDDLDLEEDADDAVEVSAAQVNEYKANKPFIGEVVNVLVKDKKIKRTGEYATDLKAAYAYLKKGDLKITISKHNVEVPF